jgi:hypothetical protein
MQITLVACSRFGPVLPTTLKSSSLGSIRDVEMILQGPLVEHVGYCVNDKELQNDSKDMAGALSICVQVGRCMHRYAGHTDLDR